MFGATAGGTPVLDRFLTSISELAQNRDGRKLQDFLQIEPPLPPAYNEMISELRRKYPKNAASEDELLGKCERLVPISESGSSSWASFPIFMRLYLTFLRDVNVDNLLETYNLLRALLNQCVLALGDSQMGIIVLPTVLYLSKVLAKLAIGLDSRPELIAHLLRDYTAEEKTERVTLVEQSANVVREAFIKCLTDRSGAAGPQGKPEGKRVGIYLMANLCLKLLFKCGKLRNAEQMFASISAQSPPLAFFPASQRVTYLQYLGRYLFSNNLFFPALIALQASYDECHRHAFKQRRTILIHLISCNVILGRFPSSALLRRPESEGLGDRFLPLCKIIRRGDIAVFREYTAVDSPAGDWFARHGILVQLRTRCEILVWRSLARKVFILSGFHGDPKMQTQRGPPPFLYLHKLEAAVKWIESRSTVEHPSNQAKSHAKTLLSLSHRDRDFVEDNGVEAQGSGTADYSDYIKPDEYFGETGQNVVVTSQENLPEEQITFEGSVEDLSFNPFESLRDEEDQHSGDDEQAEIPPTSSMREDESILASLLTQDLIHGYLTHKNPRFAIPGARIKGPLQTGFPNVWQTIYAKESQDDQVPGWVRPAAQMQPNPANQNPFGGAGGGRVVNLTGAKPVSALRG